LFDALRGAKRLVITWALFAYLDSSGIATLIEVLKESQRRRRNLRVCQ